MQMALTEAGLKECASRTCSNLIVGRHPSAKYCCERCSEHERCKRWYERNQKQKIAQIARREVRYPLNCASTARKIGLSAEDAWTMLREQGYACAITGRIFTPTDRTALDHCHKTGQARGFILQSLNCALGYAGDDAKTLRACAAYLDQVA